MYLAGAATLGDFASVLSAPADEASVIAELKAGSEEAYAWLIQHYQHQVYNLVYRVLSDPADAADTTQDVFIKVFRGIQRFNGASSLKTWVYRIAVHEASNRRRWWFRHKARETSIEPVLDPVSECALGHKDALVDEGASPYETLIQQELRSRVEEELRHVKEPYRTTVVLRDLEELSYEEIAEVTETSLGTVKSRLTRGREALKKRLEPYLTDSGRSRLAITGGEEVEVTP
jgi:RNA polymerase sigma-70 factor (ECF subfamily)